MTDSEHWEHLAAGNAKQARKRVAADVVLRDHVGRILLVDPTYKDYWDLPGGMAEANESPRTAAARELHEELGLRLSIGRLLTVDWEPPHGPWDDQLVFVFDGGRLTETQARDLRITDTELNRFAFLEQAQAFDRLRADMAARLRNALTALERGATVYGE